MEMTSEQKVKAWYEEWGKSEPFHLPDEMIAFAAFCLDKSDILPEAEAELWASLNHTLLVNFLHLPEEHQIHLMESMLVKRPKLKELLNALKEGVDD
jgi:hypothetical protein